MEDHIHALCMQVLGYRGAHAPRTTCYPDDGCVTITHMMHGNNQPRLPQPEAAAIAHSRRVTAHIQAEIQANGPIDFARYMELVLYAPGLGYYSSGSHKLGAAGDFVTAPEISPLFSYALARQCQQILATISQGVILELGAGSGRMASDLLAALEQLQALPKRYYILEISAELKARQQHLLQQERPHLFSRIEWIDRLPAAVQGIILANEVLDALPVRRFKIAEHEVQAFAVNWAQDHFTWQLAAADTELTTAVSQLGNLPAGYESEYSALATPWIASLATALQQGVILLLDYGFPQHEFYHPDRQQGTLRCHYRHFAHDDPFWWPGLQDITAHVNFSQVAAAGVAAGLQLAGYTTQAYFLLGCGITDCLTHEVGSVAAFEAAQQVKKLTLPSEMGELFKAIAFTRQCDVPLLGFQFRDLREKL